MSSDPTGKRPVFFTSEFKRSQRQLAKKYPKTREDVEPLLQTLSNGNKPGNKIPGVGFDLHKVRLKNFSAKRGKSGGFRVIYEVRSDGSIVLITRLVEHKEIATNQLNNRRSETR